MKSRLLLAALTMTTTLSAASQLLFLGTYTPKDGASRGIYVARFDPAGGTLSEPVLAAETPNPTFLALHPNGRVLYALTDLGFVEGRRAGAVNAYALEPATGRLTLLNQQPTGGDSLAHLAVDATGRALVAASYGGGYVAGFPLGADGRLGACTGRIPLEGSPGPNRIRQDKSHAHSVTFSPDNRHVLVADLGLDRVFSFRLDAARAMLTLDNPPFVTVPPGAGPRHSKFSGDGRFFYVLNEIDGSISVCAYDAGRGVSKPFQHISTLPPDFKVTDPDRAAEIRVHPNGKFVYASNRGHDSIAVFAIGAGGSLQLVEITPSGGGHPRNFSLSPDGAWLVCANHDSNNLVVFRVDPVTGRLAPSGHTASVPSPVCVLFHG